MLRNSPFVKMADDSVLLKFAPIELHWPSKHENAEFRQSTRPNGGQLWNSRWFRSPPKVRVVPGILGPCPEQETHGGHRHPGENIDEVFSESEHRLSHLDSSSRAKEVHLVSPNPDPKSPHKTLTNLGKFVGHFWKGAPTRSYAAAVRADPAPVIRVRMQS